MVGYSHDMSSRESNCSSAVPAPVGDNATVAPILSDAIPPELFPPCDQAAAGINSETGGLLVRHPSSVVQPNCEARTPQGLDKSPLSEGKYVPDVGNDPAQWDIERLCRVWAEVGRAILLRRRNPSET